MATDKTAAISPRRKAVTTRAVEPRKRRTSAENRERLIRAAREEFRKFGFAGATTAAIARSADVTETQLFRYYPTKADLFREAVFEPLNAHFSEFTARPHDDQSGDDGDRNRARLYVDELQSFLDEHSKLLVSLMVAQTFTSGSLQGVGDIDSLRSYFERGAAMMTSRVAENPAVDPRLLVRVSFAAVLGCVMFKEWMFPADFAPSEEINAAIIDFMMNGINVNSDAGPKSAERPVAKKMAASKKTPAGKGAPANKKASQKNPLPKKSQRGPER